MLFYVGLATVVQLFEINDTSLPGPRKVLTKILRNAECILNLSGNPTVHPVYVILKISINGIPKRAELLLVFVVLLEMRLGHPTDEIHRLLKCNILLVHENCDYVRVCMSLCALLVIIRAYILFKVHVRFSYCTR